MIQIYSTTKRYRNGEGGGGGSPDEWGEFPEGRESDVLLRVVLGWRTMVQRRSAIKNGERIPFGKGLPCKLLNSIYKANGGGTETRSEGKQGHRPVKTRPWRLEERKGRERSGFKGFAW